MADKKEVYAIGDKTWAEGVEVTVSSLPYERYGGSFQDARDSSGRLIIVPTPEQTRKDVAERFTGTKEEMKGFRRSTNPVLKDTRTMPTLTDDPIGGDRH